MQVLVEEEDIASPRDEVLLYVQRWLRGTWQLGPRIELVVKLASPLNDAAQQLAAITDINDVHNLKFMYLCSTAQVYLYDLTKEEISYDNRWTAVDETSSIVNAISYGMIDGNMLLVQDTTEELRVFSEKVIDTCLFFYFFTDSLIHRSMRLFVIIRLAGRPQFTHIITCTIPLLPLRPQRRKQDHSNKELKSKPKKTVRKKKQKKNE